MIMLIDLPTPICRTYPVLLTLLHLLSDSSPTDLSLLQRQISQYRSDSSDEKQDKQTANTWSRKTFINYPTCKNRGLNISTKADSDGSAAVETTNRNAGAGSTRNKDAKSCKPAPCKRCEIATKHSFLVKVDWSRPSNQILFDKYDSKTQIE